MHSGLASEYKGHAILHSAAFVVAQAEHVTINQSKLTNLAEQLLQSIDSKTPLQNNWLNAAPEPVKEHFASLSLAERTLFLTVFHTIGFCYWGRQPSKRWTITLPDSKSYDGSMALLVTMAHANFLDVDHLATLDFEQIKKLLSKGFSENINALQLLEERHQHLVDLAKLLRTMPTILSFTEATAIAQAQKFAKTLPGFLDIASYKDRPVAFLKRAQILVSDLNQLLVEAGQSGIAQIDQLTAFADYKLPQILHHHRVLEYKEGLAERIYNQIEIKAGSDEEIEIRAATIMAVELIKQEMAKSGFIVSAADIDNRLWQLAQKLDKNAVKPYHRCRTIYY